MLDILTPAEHRILKDNPEGGFISRFEAWAAMKTDAPTYTLKAAALQTLSLAAGDTTALRSIFNAKPVHMNLYALVVGPSTVMRKSTVLSYIRDLLPKNQQTHADYIVYMDDVSTQALNKVMADSGKAQSPILLNMDEVAGMFATARRKNSYLAGIDSILLKAYDHSPISVHRTTSSLDVPTGAFVNLFAASTPEPLLEVLNTDDIESGLLPRFLIFDVRDAQRGRRIPLRERMEKTAEWEEKGEGLKDFLYAIAKNRADGVPQPGDIPGVVTYPLTMMEFSDDALDRLDLIDEDFSKAAGTDETGHGAIKGRAFWHIFKLSGLYALSRAGHGATVEIIDVLRAIWLVEATTADLARMKEEVGSNSLERSINDALAIIAETEGLQVRQSVIANRMSLSARDLRELAATMQYRALIKVETDATGTPIWRRA